MQTNIFEKKKEWLLVRSRDKWKPLPSCLVLSGEWKQIWSHFLSPVLRLTTPPWPSFFPLCILSVFGFWGEDKEKMRERRSELSGGCFYQVKVEEIYHFQREGGRSVLLIPGLAYHVCNLKQKGSCLDPVSAAWARRSDLQGSVETENGGPLLNIYEEF